MEKFEKEELMPVGYRFFIQNERRIFRIDHWDGTISFRVFLVHRDDPESQIPVVVTRVRRIRLDSPTVSKPDVDIPRRYRRISL